MLSYGNEIAFWGSLTALVLFLLPIAQSAVMFLALDPGVARRRVTVPLIRLPHMGVSGPKMALWKPLGVYVLVFASAVALATDRGLLLLVYLFGVFGIFVSDLTGRFTSLLPFSHQVQEPSTQQRRHMTKGDAVTLLCYGHWDNATMEELWNRALPLVVYLGARGMPGHLLHGKQLDWLDFPYLLATAVMFGWMHVPRRGWATGIRTGVLGFVYGLIAVRCGLLASVVPHVSFNLMQSNLQLGQIVRNEIGSFLRRGLTVQKVLFRGQYYLGGAVAFAFPALYIADRWL